MTSSPLLGTSSSLPDLLKSVPKSPPHLFHSLCPLTFSTPIQGLLPSPAPMFSAVACRVHPAFPLPCLSTCPHNVPKSKSLPHIYPVLITLLVNTRLTSQATAYRFMWFYQSLYTTQHVFCLFVLCLRLLTHLSLHHQSDFYTSFKIQLRNSLF